MKRDPKQIILLRKITQALNFMESAHQRGYMGIDEYAALEHDCGMATVFKDILRDCQLNRDMLRYIAEGVQRIVERAQELKNEEV